MSQVRSQKVGVHTVLGQLYKLKALNAEATTGILLEIRILSKAAKNDNVQSLSFPTLLETRRLCLFSRHHRNLRGDNERQLFLCLWIRIIRCGYGHFLHRLVFNRDVFFIRGHVEQSEMKKLIESITGSGTSKNESKAKKNPVFNVRLSFNLITNQCSG